MLQKMRGNQKGFTLIELMIVIAIIGILAAIAIPQFAEYRKKSYKATMEADAKNLMTSLESLYSEASPPSYAAANGVNITGPGATTVNNVQFKASKGNIVTISADASGYTINVTNSGAPSGSTIFTVNNAGTSSWQ